MRFYYYSDLHTEHGVGMPAPPADSKESGLILAGDIFGSPRLAPHFLKECSAAWKHIIYVLGNHEYYRQDLLEAPRLYEDMCAQFDNVHLLHRKGIILGGETFLGATLWTDYDNDNPLNKIAALTHMNDFRLISKGGYRITPDDLIEQHKRDRDWLFGSIPANALSIMITHHLPSYNSIRECYKGNNLNAAYASSLDALVEKKRPTYIIHGHIHNSADYKIGDTRVLCNPRGYPHDPNVKFNPYAFIEV